MTEHELLDDYVRNGSEAAFGELVARYLSLVYSVAIRRMNGDAQSAQEVTQTVFTDLARKARSLPAQVMLGGWLHRHTCFVAAGVLRGERRRQERERQALEMNTLNESSDAAWKRVAPVLDEAIDRLGAADRHAILLRFFEQRDLRAVGLALGISEDAAQKRVARAVERLRETFAKRGVSLSAALLAAGLGTEAISAAPAGLAAGVTLSALAGAGSSVGLAAGLLSLLASMKVPLALGTVAAAIVAATLILQSRKSELVPGPMPEARQLLAGSPNPVAPEDAASTQLAVAAGQSALGAASTNVPDLRLTIVAADSGRPVPNVRVEYRGWVKDWCGGKILRADRRGVCDVTFSRETVTELQLTTQIDDFADTRLHWRADKGEQIPSSYTVRLIRPVAIGGSVVDADGKPVDGTKVWFKHAQEPAAMGSPEDHQFIYMMDVTTDANGKWTINRIAPELIHRLHGMAQHPQHVDSGLIFTDHDPKAEEQLREGTYVFHLGRAIQIHGSVVNAEGLAIGGALVFAGTRNTWDRRETKSLSDGTFMLAGCAPGKNTLTAEAKGFATDTIEVEAKVDSEPFRLVLGRGGVVRLRVVKQSGEPVPQAGVWLETIMLGAHGDPSRATPVQAEFEPTTDAEGRVVWTNAPDGELTFGVTAAGYMRAIGIKARADGEEHVVTLPPALVVFGTVRDLANGELIPSFRIIAGLPEKNSLNGAITPKWSGFENNWFRFNGGDFKHTFEDPLILGTTNNPGYMLKFDAEGYAPFVSRVLQADEGEIRLDVTLHAALATTVSVLLPDGGPAAGADVGLVSIGAALHLVPGGFDRSANQYGGSLLVTDGQGQFRLPSDDAITRVIVTATAGCAAADPASLATEPVLRLQPWGRLEGIALSGGQPVADCGFRLHMEGGNDGVVDFDLWKFKANSDKEGRFVFPQVLPGKHELIRIIPTSPNSLRYDPVQEVEIRAGETTTVSATNK